MINKKYQLATAALAGALAMFLGGCSTTVEQTKPRLQTAVAKSNNTYIIRRAAVHTPATDRTWQAHKAQQAQRLQQQVRKRQQLLAASRRRAANASVQPAAQPPAPANRNNNAEASKILQQQQRVREQYHARYQARQKSAQAAAAKLRHKVAVNATRKTPVTPRRATNNVAANAARVAQLKARQTQQRARQQKANQAPAQNTAQSKNHFYLERWERQQHEKRLEAKKAEQRVERVIHTAKKQIGTKYVWGGASPKTGFDCSGLVQHSIKTGADVKVPRTAAEQYKVAVKVPGKDASRGDLIFFKTRGNKVSHVGIYLGNEKFVHAPRTGRRITTSKLSGYWKQRFVGFGRIPGACKVPV